jgi:hypothetical protein
MSTKIEHNQGEHILKSYPGEHILLIEPYTFIYNMESKLHVLHFLSRFSHSSGTKHKIRSENNTFPE